MNYIYDITEDILSELPDLNYNLAQLYALLVLVQGVNTTLEDVHDAWAVWTQNSRPDHKSLVPFKELTSEVQELDRKYRDAIVRVSEKYCLKKYRETLNGI